MSAALEDGGKDAQGNNLYAALARTLTRSAALYFSRPVRLFRPSKISGWQSLKNVAILEGTALSPTFVSQLVKSQGLLVIPKHFFPPLMVNAALGTVLWTSYAEASSVLEPHLRTSPVTLAAISGAAAGGCQALIAAPVENVRHALEGGTSIARSWSHAWHEVFRGPIAHAPPVEKREKKEELRQFREWSKEVRDMAGRGWDGWGWGLAKDVCGYAVFFAIFEVTRRFAVTMRTWSQTAFIYLRLHKEDEHRFRRHFPRAVHGLTLVSGGIIAGLAYEILSRPWDVARRVVYLDRVRSIANHEPKHLALTAVANKVREDGLLSFFRDSSSPNSETISPRRRVLYNTLRVVGRAGPWGIGFLVWEAFGPGIS